MTGSMVDALSAYYELQRMKMMIEKSMGVSAVDAGLLPPITNHTFADSNGNEVHRGDYVLAWKLNASNVFLSQDNLTISRYVERRHHTLATMRPDTHAHLTDLAFTCSDDDDGHVAFTFNEPLVDAIVWRVDRHDLTFTRKYGVRNKRIVTIEIPSFKDPEYVDKQLLLYGNP